MGQLYRNSEVMLSLPLVGVCVSISASREIFVVELADSAPVSEQSFALDVCIGVFSAEPATVITDPLSFLLQHFRADLFLSCNREVLGAGQYPS
ncbi:hypothetical protein AS594_22370 [Streptomyces agglomeratus]|uniref:Uncharacterized protein n=1 Tax=Streptomyces agglomeratus TaxID=285458 RepID=A0A1E5PBB2_9ACTN|nr:hypothetical protein AS594_22370 [Streptomyces agglomeratus]